MPPREEHYESSLAFILLRSDNSRFVEGLVFGTVDCLQIFGQEESPSWQSSLSAAVPRSLGREAIKCAISPFHLQSMQTMTGESGRKCAPSASELPSGRLRAVLDVAMNEEGTGGKRPRRWSSTGPGQRPVDSTMNSSLLLRRQEIVLASTP